MSGLTCQQIVFACAERKSQRGLWLGLNAFAAYDLDRPIAFDHLICDSSAVDLRGISFHQGSPASGYRPLGGGAVTAQAQAGTRSFDPR